MADSPFSFGSVDALELVIGGMIAALVMAAPWVEGCVRALAAKTRMSMLVVAALPIVLRLLLLPHHPVPRASIRDDFGHLLVADTLLHGRLANPTHVLHRFFETTFVLQQPTYSSIYPLGACGGDILAQSGSASPTHGAGGTCLSKRPCFLIAQSLSALGEAAYFLCFPDILD